jgi:tRNA pseudouridine32 synthase/23S rRNA pseudouridine746 synthase
MFCYPALMTNTKLDTAITVLSGDKRAIDWLAENTPLSRMQLKKALAQGAVWLQQGKRRERMRRATRVLPTGAILHLYFDASVLALIPPAPQLLADERAYTVWIKPAGLLAQGTLQGDHCSLLRIAEQQLSRPVFLVHRLDREASGLMLIAHTDKAAAALSSLFQQHAGIEKHYRCHVEGIVQLDTFPYCIDQILDGKSAITWIQSVSRGTAPETSLLNLHIETGRKHQIRRHLSGLGHPVLGDVRYGAARLAERATLALTACRLVFRCPLTGQPRDYQLPVSD